MQTPAHELIIRRCWVPECRYLAALRDNAGWWWCYEHRERAWEGVAEIASYDEAERKVKAALERGERALAAENLKGYDEGFRIAEQMSTREVDDLRTRLAEVEAALDDMQRALREKSEECDAAIRREMAAEQKATNWRNDFQDACRQREAAEQRGRAIIELIQRSMSTTRLEHPEPALPDLKPYMDGWTAACQHILAALTPGALSAPPPGA